MAQILNNIIYTRIKHSEIFTDKNICPQCNHYFIAKKILCHDTENKYLVIRNVLYCSHCGNYFKNKG